MASIGWNRGRPQLRIGWTKEQAELVTQNKVEQYQANDGRHGTHTVQVWDFLVELPGPDGAPTRLVIHLRELAASMPQLPQPGSAVPVLVNRGRTKAALDLDDPSISLEARRKLGRKRHEEKAAEKKAKFEARRTARD